MFLKVNRRLIVPLALCDADEPTGLMDAIMTITAGCNCTPNSRELHSRVLFYSSTCLLCGRRGSLNMLVVVITRESLCVLPPCPPVMLSESEVEMIDRGTLMVRWRNLNQCCNARSATSGFHW